MAPAAIIVNDAFAARSVTELRFLLARALELTQPSFILAAALSREDFTQLLSNVLAAFHPRQVRRKGLSDAARDAVERLRRAIPYAVSRKLGELFRKHADARFDSAKWRAAVNMSANRVGLVFGGDVGVALHILRAEHPDLGERPARELVETSPIVRDLLSFAAAEGYYICRNKLGLCELT
jgi:hypothetical protein